MLHAPFALEKRVSLTKSAQFSQRTAFVCVHFKAYWCLPLNKDEHIQEEGTLQHSKSSTDGEVGQCSANAVILAA